MKKIICLALACLIACLAFSGCAGSTTPAETPATSEPQTTQTSS
ncbi:MAG: hypothetical protein ACOYJY_07825 [Acutalibacteraceae bacterium]|jgi:ABC-type glycerol-3-phosphate transport system substrate-binding protein